MYRYHFLNLLPVYPGTISSVYLLSPVAVGN